VVIISRYTTVPSPGTEGYFTNGNPGGGIPATEVPDWWLNMVQEELRAVVVAGGLTLLTLAFAWLSTAGIETPYLEIDAQIVEVLKKTGRKPNKLVCGIEVRNALKEHPLVVDRIKYTSSKVADDAEIARLLGLDEILTSYAVRDAASEGKAANTGFVVPSKSALLLFTPSEASIETPSAGYTFSWSGLNGERRAGMKMRKFRRDENDADRIVADMAFDHKITGSDLGVFFHNIVLG
jgi:hypothetical protein